MTDTPEMTEKKRDLIAVGETLADVANALLSAIGACACTGCVGYAIRYAHWRCMEDQPLDEAFVAEIGSIRQHADLMSQKMADSAVPSMPPAANEKPY